MFNLLDQKPGFCAVPEPVCQLGSYELDLVRLYYFGWINTLSLGLNLWQQQFVSEAD